MMNQTGASDASFQSSQSALTRCPTTRQWQRSQKEENFIPSTLRETRRQLPDDVVHNSLVEEPRSRVREVSHGASLLEWASAEDAADRLHRSPTRHVSKRHVDAGVVPRHLLTGELPDPGKPVRSEDFFKPNKYDRPPAPKVPLIAAHQYRVVRTADPGAVRSYRRGVPTPEVPLRIVSHEYQGFQLNKKSPEISHRGISRNVLGGFYTN
mmetsp:Transcript_18292/g.30493  ORF Transcript_18292/g.30493 Transcript_18292/m.30493 type:complete len:210 (+) Transcript_18292:94-723(+)